MSFVTHDRSNDHSTRYCHMRITISNNPYIFLAASSLSVSSVATRKLQSSYIFRVIFLPALLFLRACTTFPPPVWVPGAEDFKALAAFPRFLPAFTRLSSYFDK